jgi:hypothetical protein
MGVSVREWRKSSRSSGGADCVELRVKDGEPTGVRDTKNRGAGQLSFSAPSFVAFLNATKSGEITQ